MLERTDLLSLAVHDLDRAIQAWAQIFDTQVIGDAADALLGARRVTLAWGGDRLELLQPTGPGHYTGYSAQKDAVTSVESPQSAQPLSSVLEHGLSQL